MTYARLSIEMHIGKIDWKNLHIFPVEETRLFWFWILECCYIKTKIKICSMTMTKRLVCDILVNFVQRNVFLHCINKIFYWILYETYCDFNNNYVYLSTFYINLKIFFLNGIITKNKLLLTVLHFITLSTVNRDIVTNMMQNVWYDQKETKNIK